MFSTLLKDSKAFIILTLISILIVLLDNAHFLALPKSLLERITSPIQYGLYKTALGINRQFDFIVFTRRSAQEKKALEEQLATVISDNANLRRQLSETQGFLDQQRSLDPQTYSLVAARPISTSRYLKIDKGSSDGIKPGQPVVYKDTFLGAIKEVSEKSASVILSSDPDSKIAAFAQNSSGHARGILLGQFGSEMLMDKILHQEKISAGDLVYSEGTEGSLPRGLVLGQVSSVSERENEVFKQATLKPIFNVSDLDIVFVITN